MPDIQSTINQRKALQSAGVGLPSPNRRPARQASGKTLETQYFIVISRLIEPYFMDVRDRLIPSLPRIVEEFNRTVRVDSVKLDQSYGEIITRSIRDVQIGIALQIPLSQLKIKTEDQARNVSRFQRGQFDRQVKTVLGVNPLLSETYLEPQVQSFVERNTALIKDIPSQSLSRIETKLRTGIEAGESLQKITATVQGELRIAKNRAKLIARDQTNKFMGKLTELRQTSLGVEEYVWSTSRDERVRPSHSAKDGKRFKWNDPPSDTGHPGNEIQCRCVAIPVLDDFK
jgi:SPP1 gp7 family putative phage head morphogenesis protein